MGVLERHQQRRITLWQMVLFGWVFWWGSGAPSFGWAAEDARLLELRAVVALDCQIVIEPTPDAQQLDLEQTRSGVLVASVREVCNLPEGYTVTISSASNGQLVGGSEGEVSLIPYRLEYGPVRADLRASRASPVAVTEARERTHADGVRRAVRISHPAATDVSGGAYTDILTFTIIPR